MKTVNEKLDCCNFWGAVIVAFLVLCMISSAVSGQVVGEDSAAPGVSYPDEPDWVYGLRGETEWDAARMGVPPHEAGGDDGVGGIDLVPDGWALVAVTLRVQGVTLHLLWITNGEASFLLSGDFIEGAVTLEPTLRVHPRSGHAFIPMPVGDIDPDAVVPPVAWVLL